MKNLKIGITLGLKENNESIWTNGIKQNVLMFIDLLKKSQNNYEVCILNTVNVDWSVKPEYLKDVDIFNFNDKFMEMDLIVIMGAQVDNNHLIKFKEDKNKKVISYKCGNNYILHLESTLFGEDIKNYAQYENQFDEIWYVPQQHETNQGFYPTIYRTNSIPVPFIWNNKYLQPSLERIDNDFKNGTHKKDSKYNPSNEKKVIGIMEPNINIVKYCLIPTLITEESYRTEIGKNKIQKLMITNSKKLSKNKNFMSIIKTLDLFKDNKISSEARYQTPYVTSQYMDIVVSHQLLNPLNYLYLDLVYMGYPVLHNAYMCKDIGYYYEGSNTIEGGRMLNWILENHDKNIEEYDSKNKEILKRYHSENSKLIEIYDKLIYNLFNGGNKGLSFDVINNEYLEI